MLLPRPKDASLSRGVDRPPQNPLTAGESPEDLRVSAARRAGEAEGARESTVEVDKRHALQHQVVGVQRVSVEVELVEAAELAGAAAQSTGGPEK